MKKFDRSKVWGRRSHHCVPSRMCQYKSWNLLLLDLVMFTDWSVFLCPKEYISFIPCYNFRNTLAKLPVSPCGNTTESCQYQSLDLETVNFYLYHHIIRITVQLTVILTLLSILTVVNLILNKWKSYTVLFNLYFFSR